MKKELSFLVELLKKFFCWAFESFSKAFVNHSLSFFETLNDLHTSTGFKSVWECFECKVKDEKAKWRVQGIFTCDINDSSFVQRCETRLKCQYSKNFTSQNSTNELLTPSKNSLKLRENTFKYFQINSCKLYSNFLQTKLFPLHLWTEMRSWPVCSKIWVKFHSHKGFSRLEKVAKKSSVFSLRWNLCRPRQIKFQVKSLKRKEDENFSNQITDKVVTQSASNWVSGKSHKHENRKMRFKRSVGSKVSIIKLNWVIKNLISSVADKSFDSVQN